MVKTKIVIGEGTGRGDIIETGVSKNKQSAYRISLLKINYFTKIVIHI